MTLLGAARDRDWSPVLGAGLFVALLAAGYYYNVTFVQLGLLDLGTRLVGLPRRAVSAWMGVLALATFLVAVVTGVVLDRRGWSRDLIAKLRLLCLVVGVQFALTLWAPHVRTATGFGVWILAAAVALGIGVPVTFGLTIDFVPVRDRAAVAAAITALAYVAANLYPLDWQIESFSAVLSLAMAPGLLALLALASGRLSIVDRWADQHQRPAYGIGRFCRPEPVSTRSGTFWGAVLLMFGVFFVDSLGFLRIVETPALVGSAWQSPVLADHLRLAAVHAVGAVAAAVLYRNFDRQWLFLWVFGLFAVTHLLYTLDLRTAAIAPALARGPPSPLNPALYAFVVSVYTTLNFALWPDLSTPETIGRHTAIGVGLAGWVATFLSTAVALALQSGAVSTVAHLSLVNALALVLFVGLILAWYVGGARTAAREGVT